MGANVAVGAGIVAGAALAAVEAATGRPWRARYPDRTGPGRTLWLWWVAIVTLVGWELFNYAQSPRRSFPTVSSIYDHFARWEWAKAVIVAGWVVLGWAIATSFARERTRA